MKPEMCFLMATQTRRFSTKMMKRTVISQHSKEMRNSKMLKAIRILKTHEGLKKSRYIVQVEKAVQQLQPTPSTFLAPLNPSPVYNIKFGVKKLTRSIKKKPIPKIEEGTPSPEIWVYKFNEGLEKSRISPLERDVFLEPLRKDILHRVVRYFLQCKRQGTAQQKNRTAVSGGGKKPWSQKGTGRARHGSRRSPIFVGGGRVFPKTPGDFKMQLQKRVQDMGMRIAVSQKLQEDNLRVVESFEGTTPDSVFEALREKDLLPALIIDSEKGRDSSSSFREGLVSLEDVHYIASKSVNVYALLRMRTTIFTSEGLEEFQKHNSRKLLSEVYNKAVEENIKAMNKIKDWSPED